MKLSPRCLYCGATTATQYAPASQILHCCPWCKSPYLYATEEHRTLSQCMQCGQLLSGPYAGTRMLRPDTGTPDLSAAISHGICEACAATMLEEHRKRRKASIAASPSPVV